MTRYGFGLAVILLLTSGTTSVAASAPAAATAKPSPDPCASAVPDLPNDLQAAFAYDLESPAILRFIAVLATVPQRDQQRVFAEAVRAASSPAEQQAAAAVAALCPNLDELYGTSRALYLIVNAWKLGGLADEKQSHDFSSAVETALWSLSVAQRLTPEQRRLAMLPFVNLGTPATPSPSPSKTGTCAADAPARLVHVVDPKYPLLARSASTTGLVRTKVSLSDTGDIRSVRIYTDSLHGRPGAQEVIRATILAAAASTYAPEIRGCRAVAGVYIFEVDFSRG